MQKVLSTCVTFSQPALTSTLTEDWGQVMFEVSGILSSIDIRDTSGLQQ